MSGLEILSADAPAERRRWLELWQGSEDREVFAHPAYVALWAREGQRVCCAAWEGPEGRALFPLILRPLAAEPWCPDELAHLHDIDTPYGFGGPFQWDVRDRAALSRSFWGAFDAWARERGVTCVFSRLPLVEDMRLDWPEGVVQINVNVLQDLRTDPDALWSSYKHKVRKNVKKARRHGLVCTVDDTLARLDDFLAVYHATMERNDAADRYFFDRAFFVRLLEGVPGGWRFFHVWDGERLVSTELVLVSAHHLFSFLGGTLADAFPARPNDLLKHTASVWGVEQGKRGFVLGGGYEPEDGIYQYKLAFAPEGGGLPLYAAKRDLQPELTAALVEARRRAEPGWAPRPDFFPPYR